MKLSTLITPTTPTQDNEQNLQTSCLENILQENCLLQQFAGQSPKICKTNHPQRQYPKKIYPEYICRICGVCVFWLVYFSCPRQLYKWPCHPLSESVSDIYFSDFIEHYKAVVDTCDLSEKDKDKDKDRKYPKIYYEQLRIFLIYCLSIDIETSNWLLSLKKTY